MSAIQRGPLFLLLALGASGAARQDFQQSVVLSAHGRVAIENLYGDVRITGWDREEVRIEAVKSAADGARLDDARIVIDGTAERLSIRTQYDGGEAGDPASVEYRINVPRTAALEDVRLVNGALSISGMAGSVKATSVNGSIKAEQLGGRADLSTVNGQVEAGFQRVAEAQPISLRSVNGPIVLSLPPGTRAQLIAQNRSGEIQSDLEQPRPQLTSHRFQAVLGGGGPQILLDNVNGGISIHSTWSRRREKPAL